MLDVDALSAKEASLQKYIPVGENDSASRFALCEWLPLWNSSVYEAADRDEDINLLSLRTALNLVIADLPTRRAADAPSCVNHALQFEPTLSLTVISNNNSTRDIEAIGSPFPQILPI